MPAVPNEPFINRHDKSANLSGTLAFVAIRALDPLIQYSLLARGLGVGLITGLGGSVLSQSPPSTTGIAAIDSLGLSPYRLAILGMSCASSLKHIIWKSYIGEQYMGLGLAAAVGTLHTIGSTVNSLLFLCRATSAATASGEGPYSSGWPGVRLVLGLGLFTVGVVVELTSELQRKSFKDKPENKGKPHTTGLFSLARHINYTGYTLWRAGYGIACSGYIFGTCIGAMAYREFSLRAVPALGAYCEKRVSCRGRCCESSPMTRSSTAPCGTIIVNRRHMS